MKKTVLCCAIALVFLFGLSATMVQAQKFDDMWFKTKVKGNLQVGDAQGDIAKEKGKDTAYLYLQVIGGIPCGGYQYDITMVAETADDVWEEIGGGTAMTCASAEEGFWATMYWTIDIVDFSMEMNGIVKGDPTLKSKGCAVWADDGSNPTGTGFLPPAIGKKCKINAPDIDCDKLPFDPVDLQLPPCPGVVVNGVNGG